MPHESKPVYLSSVRVRDAVGEQNTFESGRTAWVDIEVTARERVEKLTISIWLRDQAEYEIFDTSTERLGCDPIALQPGQSYRCTFELTLNVAHGKFELCADVLHVELEKIYDQRIPAASLFVGSSMAVRGAVNCFPRVVESVVYNRGTENAVVR